MKAEKWAAILLIAAFLAGGKPFAAAETARLLPAEIVRISKRGPIYRIETDQPGTGRGRSIQKALENLKEKAPGIVFLETAQTVLVQDLDREDCRSLLSILRPGCGLCRETGQGDLKETAEFLKSHPVCYTVKDAFGDEKNPEILVTFQKERYFVGEQS